MIYRCILPEWAAKEDNSKLRVLEGEFTWDYIQDVNKNGYNIYFLPNYPSIFNNGGPSGRAVEGSDIDIFNFVYVDFDLKSDTFYKSKEAFIERLNSYELKPTFIVDSGNGIHAYWEVSDLDGLLFLKLQRRLCRFFKTDEAVSKIYQLMRTPNTYNTKRKDAFKLCHTLSSDGAIYTAEQLDTNLPAIIQADENYCQIHYNKTYKIDQKEIIISDIIPEKFLQLVMNNNEVKKIWSGDISDRSKGDYRLAHIMFAAGLTKDEAMSVLVNSSKALARAPIHRISYATNIVDQIWLYELTEDKTQLKLSNTVKEILDKHGTNIKGTRFNCWKYLDNTYHGFRLGQVIGLVAGSGVGKTAMALNMFKGFVQSNPDYDHFFIPLEQPANEIADRWKTMCGDNIQLYSKVHVISNYDDDGSFRHLSFSDIEEYIMKFQEVTKRKVGCVVLDHIGALRKKGKNGENQDLMDICHSMKAFAICTNTMLVMQSQAPREKAGIGDLELNKDAAYGTVYFESYCDYLITMWQPLKRCYMEAGCPTITAFKFCKIRHKKKDLDLIQEDLPYTLYFDSKTEHMRELTEKEEKAFMFWNQQATNKRKQDRKTDIVKYVSAKDGVTNAETVHNPDLRRVS